MSPRFRQQARSKRCPVMVFAPANAFAALRDGAPATLLRPVADVNQSNGVIHVIDKVLLPK